MIAITLRRSRGLRSAPLHGRQIDVGGGDDTDVHVIMSTRRRMNSRSCMNPALGLRLEWMLPIRRRTVPFGKLEEALLGVDRAGEGSLTWPKVRLQQVWRRLPELTR